MGLICKLTSGGQIYATTPTPLTLLCASSRLYAYHSPYDNQGLMKMAVIDLVKKWNPSILALALSKTNSRRGPQLIVNETQEAYVVKEGVTKDRLARAGTRSKLKIFPLLTSLMDCRLRQVPFNCRSVVHVNRATNLY